MARQPKRPQAPSGRRSRPTTPTGKPKARPKGKPKAKPTRNRPDKASRPSQDEQGGDSLIRLKITDMAQGGYGLAFHQRRPVFVPYTIPGEQVRAHIVPQSEKTYAGSAIHLVAASGDRIYPQCDHFGPGLCWGCQWQHIDYRAQCLLKYDVLADQLQRFGKFDDRTLQRALTPVVAAPALWGYNHHITFERAENGFGLRRVDGRSIEPITMCHILHPELQELYEQISIDHESVVRLQLIRGSDGATMAVLTLRDEEAPQLAADFPTSVNILLPDNEPVNLIGDSHTTYHVLGHDLRVTAGGSFRANVAQVGPLVEGILSALALQPTARVLDLYAGAGVFSTFVAPHAELVTMVESYPPLVTDAETNLEAFDNIDVVEGRVEDVLASLNEAEERYDAAIVDPPASGLSGDALRELCQMAPPRIVYLSSNPATLGRDAQTLIRHGYHLAQVKPFDFAPHTYYIDALALFRRA